MAIATGSLLTAAAYVALYSPMDPAHSARLRRPATIAEVRGLLARVGVEPEALAAIGCLPQQAGTIATAALAYLGVQGGAIETIRTADQSARTARLSAAHASRDVQSGSRAASEARPDLASTASTQAQAELQARLDDLFNTVTATLSAEQRAQLRLVLANRHREVPIEFLAETRTDAQWVALREALSTRDARQRRGESVPASASAVITSADNTAASRRALVANHAESLREAFNTALPPG
jgi:hypothetical protein